MFMVGLSMVTQGGMYVLQLLDNHAGTFSALINGVVEVVVLGWIYGIDRFLGDIQVMFQWPTNSWRFRTFQLYWKTMWSLVTPTLLLAILSVTFVGYEPMSYGSYIYPGWANVLGWAVSASSVLFIPLVAVWKISHEEGGTFQQRLRNLLQPSTSWGPSQEQNRLRAEEAWDRHGRGAATSHQDPDDEELSDLSKYFQSQTLLPQNLEKPN